MSPLGNRTESWSRRHVAQVDEHIGVVVADGESGPRGARLASRVPRSTLDAELAGFTADADVDVLSIHGNGGVCVCCRDP